MSGDGSVVCEFGGEERRFRLRIGELRELQEKINERRGAHPIGPWSLLQLVIKGDAWPDDLREIIRLGLIGGGCRIELVGGLVKRYVDERPMRDSWSVAMLVLGKAIVGDDYDQVGKKKSEDQTTTATTFSGSPISTDQAPQSDSHPDKSTSAPSGNSQHVSRDTTARMAPRISNPE